MDPVYIPILAACAGWFFVVAASAGKSTGVRVGLSILGVVEFVVVMVILQIFLREQDFFRRAIRSGPDVEAIMLYMVLPAVIVVFLTGLGLRHYLRQKRTVIEPD